MIRISVRHFGVDFIIVNINNIVLNVKKNGITLSSFTLKLKPTV